MSGLNMTPPAPAVAADADQSRTSGDMAVLQAALAKAQAAMGDAEKNQTNPHFQTKYADLASIRAATLPHLNANGLAIVQIPQFQGERFVLTTRLAHDSGAWIESDWPLPLNLLTDYPKMMSALTYYRRGSWAAMCGIAPGDDDDAASVANAETAADAKARAKKDRDAELWGGPLNKKELQAAIFEMLKEIDACPDEDTLDQYLNTPEAAEIQRQVRQDIPSWWYRDNLPEGAPLPLNNRIEETRRKLQDDAQQEWRDGDRAGV